MQCCVPNCASNELETNKSENSGITYHELPKDPQTRSRWMQGLRLGDWRPNTNSVVCSLHLSNEDFVPSGLCAMKTDVDDVPMTEMHCRMCLSSDRKVYNIGENDIAQQYELLTASKDCVGDVLPQYICWECKARLASFARLRSVALRSLQLLHEFYETVNNKKTPQDLRLIAVRDTNNFTSTLIHSNTETVDYPPGSELLVEFDVKPDNTVSSNFKNRNDNDKSTNAHNVLNEESTEVKNENDNSLNKNTNHTKVSKVLSKGKLNTKVINENDNSGNKKLGNHRQVLNKGKISTIVVNENDNSGSNKVKHNLERTIVSKTNKGGKSKKNENDNSDSDDENDNFDNDIFDTDSDETDCQKADTDNNSGLEDMMYDSDTTKSEDDNIKGKLDTDLAKIYHMFTDQRLGVIKRDINTATENENDNDKAIDDNPKIDKEIREYFDIKVLSKDEQLKEFLERKESDNYKNAGFKCDICYKGFIRKKAFDLHKIAHTDVNGPMKCPICGFNFRNAGILRHHFKQSHQLKYSCNQCDYVTGALFNAKLHVKFHKGTIYKCTQCDKTFQKKTSWFTHIRIHHPSDVVCRLCGYSFVSENGLRNHTARKHQQKLVAVQVPEDGPRCVECNIQFSTDAALTTHYQESNKHKHLLPKKLSRKRGASNDSKPVYSNQPTWKPAFRNKGPVVCEVCNIELPNNTKYRWHFKEQHPDQVRTKFPGNSMCEICGQFFSCQAVLEEHKESVHADVKKKYSCEECGKKLNTKSSLYVHTKTHLNKKQRYSCDICENTFSSYGNMQRHKILHENLKLDCNICGKSFNHPQNRRTHIDFVHKKKPLPVRKNRVRVKKGKNESTESLQSMEEETINYD